MRVLDAPSTTLGVGMIDVGMMNALRLIALDLSMVEEKLGVDVWFSPTRYEKGVTYYSVDEDRPPTKGPKRKAEKEAEQKTPKKKKTDKWCTTVFHVRRTVDTDVKKRAMRIAGYQCCIRYLKRTKKGQELYRIYLKMRN
jgi:hypothetical protein